MGFIISLLCVLLCVLFSIMFILLCYFHYYIYVLLLLLLFLLCPNYVPNYVLLLLCSLSLLFMLLSLWCFLNYVCLFIYFYYCLYYVFTLSHHVWLFCLYFTWISKPTHCLDPIAQTQYPNWLKPATSQLSPSSKPIYQAHFTKTQLSPHQTNLLPLNPKATPIPTGLRGPTDQNLIELGLTQTKNIKA